MSKTDKKYTVKLIAALCGAAMLSAAFTTPALAHHGSASAAFGPGAPVETTAPQTLPQGKFLFYERYEEAPYHKKKNAEPENVQRFTFFNTMLGYGISDALSGYLILPYAIKEQDNVGTSKGFGDVELMLQYGFKYGDRDGIVDWYKYGPEDSNCEANTIDDWKFVVFGSVSLPTGRVNNKNDDGEEFDMGMQPGFGANSYSFGAAMSKQLAPRTTLTMDTSLRAFAQHNEGKPGNEWRVNGALGYEVIENPGGCLSRLDLIGEANFLQLGHDQDENPVSERDTGGDILYLSPAMRMTFADCLSIGLMVKFPVIRSLNKKDVQQGAEGLEKYRAIATVSYAF